jgi:hypothetical protein
MKDAFGVEIGKAFIPKPRKMMPPQLSRPTNNTVQHDLPRWKKTDPDGFKAHLEGMRSHKTPKVDAETGRPELSMYPKPYRSRIGASSPTGATYRGPSSPIKPRQRADAGVLNEAKAAVAGMPKKSLKRLRSRPSKIYVTPQTGGAAGLYRAQNPGTFDSILVNPKAEGKPRTVAHELAHLTGRKNQKRSVIRMAQIGDDPVKLGKEEARVEHLSRNFKGGSGYGKRVADIIRGDKTNLGYNKFSEGQKKQFAFAHEGLRRKLYQKGVPSWKAPKDGG